MMTSQSGQATSTSLRIDLFLPRVAAAKNESRLRPKTMQTAALNPFELLPLDLLLCEIGSRLDTRSFLCWRHTCKLLFILTRIRGDAAQKNNTTTRFTVLGQSCDLGAMHRAYFEAPHSERANKLVEMFYGACLASDMQSVQVLWQLLGSTRARPKVQIARLLSCVLTLDIYWFLRQHVQKFAQYNELIFAPTSIQTFILLHGSNWLIDVLYRDFMFRRIKDYFLEQDCDLAPDAVMRLHKMFPAVYRNFGPGLLQRLAFEIIDEEYACDPPIAVFKTRAYLEFPKLDWRGVAHCEIRIKHTGQVADAVHSYGD